MYADVHMLPIEVDVAEATVKFINCEYHRNQSKYPI